MKKQIFVFLSTVIFLIISSCKKDNSSGAFGSWALNSTTLPASVLYTKVLGAPGTLVVSNSSVAPNSNSVGDLNLIFYDTLPSISGTYTVIADSSTLIAPGQVQIWTALNNAASGFYASTGIGNSQTIQVAISDGKMSISGSQINMTGSPRNNGIGTLSFNIHN